MKQTIGKTKTEQEIQKMMSKLQNFAQYEDIPYAADFTCPECGKSTWFGGAHDLEKPKIVGYCSTNMGYMAVLECPICFTKYRFHTQFNKFDWDDFVKSIYMLQTY